ncbi:MAG: orotidine-5'-phosphate decarboxylase [Alphaproteobacteria bacterium]|nr:orotidine-5'-phosphate decarboxylase [Alphaproteobacteria bacterium]MBF0250626.1 orotidine-5'-phosphate decarboxylase [Alphaproteobacteria bacterium]
MAATLKPHERIFAALDTTDVGRAREWAEALKGHIGGVKIGKEFFTANGPDGVHRVVECGLPLFLDLKFHDIPNTVAGAIRASLALRPLIVNVHAGGGRRMMEAAAKAADEAQAGARPSVIGVTVLTSMARDDLAEVGVDEEPLEQVLRLARLAKGSGLDGVVCSAKEVVALRGSVGRDFLLVVPGIRPQWAGADDQKRVVTPRDAVDLGADYLVIGRPITGHKDPAEAARLIAEELAGAK